MKPAAIPCLMVLALAGSAWAVSPYDTAYGVQWSFLNGNSGADAPNVATLSPDGTIWIATGGTGQLTGGTSSPMLTWGSPKSVYGGASAAGYGQINRLGGIIQCNDIPNVVGVSVFSQSPNTIVRFSGTNATAYIGGAPNSLMRWTDAVPPDVAGGGTHPFTFPVNSGLNQTGFEPYGGLKNSAGDPLETILPRKNVIDVTKKFTHNLVSVDSYGGSAFDFQVASDGSYFICRGAQGPGAADPLTKGDSFTAGDFSGPVNLSYKPAVGKISADGTTKSGPAHQPECPGRSFFSDIDINESANAGAGRVYVCGNGFQGSGGGPMTYFDADGPGTDFAPVTFTSTTPSTTKGFAVVYNATTWAIDKVVTWETAQGGDQPNDIESTADGGFVLVGGTNGSMAGFTNPALLTSDAYMEVYNAAGTLAWSFQTQTAFADNFGDVSVDTDGSIYVSGNSNGNPALWKFTSAGTLVWTTTIDNAGTVESQRDHNGDKKSFFYLSSHNKTTSGIAAWPNTIAYVPQGTDDNLLQKLSPGDFNGDKFVNFTDVQLAGTATKPGLPGNDTYDFNGDGDSTLADTTYMITNIMDRLVGDIAQDKIVTDVDNADIGRAIGASGVGTLYLDGDVDFDADVDAANITAVAAAFTGSKAFGAYANGTPGATLRYRASDGQVWLHADEATGDIITSFQLENAAGTFVPASFTGPTGGSFGGALKEATTSVLADTDLTLAGSGGIGGLISLGTVLPTGMDLTALTAYLKTAVYTGQPGSGQMQFTLLVGDLLSPYESWTASFGGLTKKYSNIDFDNGGLDTGIEWVVGGDPTVPGDDAGNTPSLNNSDPSDFKFVFKRRDAAAADSNTKIVVEYGSDLSGWRNTTDHGVIDGVTTDDSVDLGGGFHQVTVSIPKILAVGGKLFARLGVSGLPISYIDTDFEGDDGGFTISKVAGTDWAWGAPNSSGLGGTVNSGNGSSLKCWGTNIGNPGFYVDPTTDSRLTSPVINLTSVVGAKLSFAHAIDIPGADSAVVRIFNADTNTEIVSGAFPLTITDADINTSNWQNSGPHDLPSGAPIRIVWTLSGTGGASDDYMGWYVDDVQVVDP